MRRAETFVCSAAIAFGTLARLFLTFEKPLWADEVFTLDLSRRSVGEILRTLRVDSGPPLHYLLAKLALLPFPTPGRGDVAVRLLSLAASLLSLPLLLAIGRRLQNPRAGLVAAALFSLSPLLADYAAEGRGYAVACLLVLAALHEALAVRESPSVPRAVGAGLLAAAAVLTHYLALFPVAGLATLLLGASLPARRALLLAAATCVAALLPWAAVALRQPTASMAWTQAMPRSESLARFAVNLGLSFEPPGPRLALLAALSVALLAAVLLAAARTGARPLAGVVLVGLAALLAAHLATGALVLPERTALPFLPLVALLVGAAPLPLSLPAGAAAFLALSVKLPAATGVSPSEALARALVDDARKGRRICAAGLWGPELDYRLRAAGLPSRVVLFPSDVALHRGWYVENASDAARFASEAKEAVEGRRADLWVVPFGTLAGDALRQALAPRAPARVLTSPFFEVVATRR